MGRWLDPVGAIDAGMDANELQRAFRLGALVAVDLDRAEPLLRSSSVFRPPARSFAQVASAPASGAVSAAAGAFSPLQNSTSTELARENWTVPISGVSA